MSWFWSKSETKPDEFRNVNDLSDVYSDLDVDANVKAFARGDGEAPSPPQQVPKDLSAVAPPTVSEESNFRDEMDGIVKQVKTRKQKVNAGAMFNCALAEFELSQCFTNGSWWDKSKLCESQKSAFWSCLEGNKKALNILGYEEAGNTEEQNEKLLSMADDLVGLQLVTADLY